MGMIIAVDGYSATGKGTLCRALARETGFAALDTGGLYRAVAGKALDDGADGDEARCAFLASSLSGDDLRRTDLRSERIGAAASRISAMPLVRNALLEMQRRFAGNPPDDAPGAILDGRDIGTVVCPDADLKLFLIADASIRARRRYDQEKEANGIWSLSEIADALRQRDERDTTRSTSPMVPAHDAVVVDTGWLTRSEVLEVAMDALAAAIRRIARERSTEDAAVQRLRP